MPSRIYVGNIPFLASNESLREFFTPYEIVSVKIVVDHETNKPRGFAFVDLKNTEDAPVAIKQLDGTDMGGRKVKVSAANERRPIVRREADANRSEHNEDTGFESTWKK